jgi:lipopolysaccharide/colanic/teichoic acid biosynthesis glycosyltransferase
MINYSFWKRLIDIILSLIFSIIFLPVWFIVPILILLDSPGAVIYRHKRVGKDNKEFYMYKFRTMVANAEEILFKKDKQLLEKFKKGDWKLENDPRITRLGRLIRNLTIDEFPQIYNVLKGDMSIVGPRAYVRREIDDQTRKYPKTRKLMDDILKVRPGITGPWQTSGRNEIPFVKRATMDAWYSRNYTFWQDLGIMLKTPKAMITKW